MRRRNDNNSSHCSCIPTCQGLPRYYFYFYKLLCIWITKLRHSLLKRKKNERGGGEGKEEEKEERNSNITEISNSLSSSHTGFSLPLKHPRPVPAPGPLHFLFPLSGMLLCQRASHRLTPSLLTTAPPSHLLFFTELNAT